MLEQQFTINMEELNNAEKQEVKQEVNTQVHKHLSTIFVVVGIVSFTLGAIVNFYTIRRLNGGGQK